MAPVELVAQDSEVKMPLLNKPIGPEATLAPSIFEQAEQKKQSQELAQLQLANIRSQIGLRGAQTQQALTPKTESGSSELARMKAGLLQVFLDPNTPPEIRDRIKNPVSPQVIETGTVKENIITGDDIDLLHRAEQLGRVMFTNDQGFFLHTWQLLDQGVSLPGVVYAHPLRVSIGACIRDLELLGVACDPQDLRDRLEILPL